MREWYIHHIYKFRNSCIRIVFFSCQILFKVLYRFWYVFFYPYNFDIFVYLCRVHIIIHIVFFLSYFSFFLSCSIYIVSYSYYIIISCLILSTTNKGQILSDHEIKKKILNWNTTNYQSRDHVSWDLQCMYNPNQAFVSLVVLPKLNPHFSNHD